MKFSKILLFTLITLSSLQEVQAKNVMAILGGGGEKAGPGTLFDELLTGYADKLSETSKWEYDVSFNGGHTNTEKIVKHKFDKAKSKSTFTKESYDKLIANYKAKIISGEIGPKDQLLIFINSHGAPNTGSELTHQITGANGPSSDPNVVNYTFINLDALNGLVKLANSKGITMGIIDFSCHSGNTLKLKTPNTCIISATSPNHFSYQLRNSGLFEDTRNFFQPSNRAFVDSFIANIKPGMSLEQIYLNARKNSSDMGYPMIGTEENEKIFQEIYSKLMPYMFYNDTHFFKLNNYLISNANEANSCKRDKQFEDLIKNIENLKKYTPESPYIDEMKKELARYKKDQDEMIAQLKALGGDRLNTVESFSVPIAKSKKVISNSLTWKKIIDEQPEKWIAQYSDLAKKVPDSSEKNENLALVEYYKKVKNKKEEILKKYPNLKNIEKASQDLVKKFSSHESNVEKIAVLERKLYNQMYEVYKNQNKNDPCRKITF
jgi:hypothetical protein